MTQKQTRRLIRSGLVVVLFLSLEKVGGLVRGMIMANIFGAGQEADAFSAANQLPELLYAMLAGSALSAALIPIYSNYLTAENDRERTELYQSILTLLILILGTISLIGVLMAQPLGRLLVPDFTAELQQLTGRYMQLVLISLTIVAVSMTYSTLLHAHQHFSSTALAPAGQDIGRITGLVAFVPRLGAIGAGWGVVLGSLLHLIIQIPAIMKHRLWFRPRLSLKLDGLHKVGRLMWPRIASMGAVQLADLVIIRTASGFDEGSISAYFYALLIASMPISFFGWSLNGVVFPTMVERFNAADITTMKRVAVRTAEVVWVLMLPSVVGLIMLGRPALSLILEGKAFDRADTLLVYSVIVAMSGQTLLEPLIDQFDRLFYAQHNTITPMVARLGWLVVYGVLIVLCGRRYGIVGIGVGTSVAAAFLCLTLYVLNKRTLGDLHERAFGWVCGRSIVAVFVMTLTIHGIAHIVTSDFPFLLIAVIGGGGAYVVTFYALNGHKQWGNLSKLGDFRL